MKFESVLITQTKTLSTVMAMTKFRPCIDLHEGKVKQIIGGTLSSSGAKENFVSEQPPAWYAEKFAADNLRGGHVIQLGPGNEEAAMEALAAWSGGLQIGGGVTLENAARWLERGAERVIVTSWLFDAEGNFLPNRLAALASEIGPEKIVVDLSCRRVSDGWRVAMNRWQTITAVEIEMKTLAEMAPHCAEFLIHAADVEGKCEGVDQDLVALLGGWKESPITYAGGVRGLADLRLIDQASDGRLDATVGSALDLFGGGGVTYAELLEWNSRAS